MIAYVTGTSVSTFTRRATGSLFDSADLAVSEALAHAGLGASDIDEVFVGSGAGAPTIGAKLMEYLGFVGVPATRVEQACASGSTALRMALDAVSWGGRHNVLVVGLDELRQGVLDLSDPSDHDALLGLNLLPAYFGLKTDQYMYKHKVGIEEIAQVAVHAKRSAVSNPRAAYAADLSIGEVQGATPVADPLTKLHCCGNASGAAAVVVSSVRRERSIKAMAWAQTFTAADPSKIPDGGRDDLERTVERLADVVYRDAGITASDVDVVQINDAFTVCGPLYVEALGLADPGSGLELFADDSGKVKVNLDGGLLGRGHCLGATGLAMVHDIHSRLTIGPDAEIGLVQSHGLGADLLFCFTSA
jgi:acetyl-CoA acetyltransferase